MDTNTRTPQPNPNRPAELGTLERVEVTSAWPGEASHFTPWLALPDNIDLLGNAIGLELEVLHQEHAVGLFRADIVCADTASGRKVLVENQFGKTDHTHLGQLLTYAAGVDPMAVVWIAERFREEHRAAIDWLNRVTSDAVNFFGVEIELWRIGQSLPAPKFNVVAKPNEWVETVARAESGITGTGSQYLAYWTAFREYAAKRPSLWRLPSPNDSGTMIVALGRSNVFLTAIVTLQKQSGHVQVVLAGPLRIAWFKHFEARRTEVEAALGTGLEWRELPDGKESHIRRNLPGMDLEDRADWERQHQLIYEQLGRFHRYFSPQVRFLPSEPLATAE